MIARTTVFGTPGNLSTHREQLVWDGQNGVHQTIPIEDLGFVILESEQIAITISALQKLADANVAVVLCDSKHLPLAQMLPYTSHSTAQESIEAQLAASEAVNGRVWRMIISSKIANQAALLLRLGFKDEARHLENISKAVKNGDPQNLEGQAARIYFRVLSPSPDFTRDPDGIWPNAPLNYGYAILRAAVARALVGSGLVCFRGIHHHNRYNPYCLADDVMEPFRPFVDQYIFSGQEPFSENCGTLTPQVKRKLLEMLTCDVKIGENCRPLMIAVTECTASLVKYFRKKAIYSHCQYLFHEKWTYSKYT